MPSLFKTLGVVLCLAFALCFAAPNAVADEFVYTVTEANITQFSFTEPTLASSGEVTSGLTQISGTTATAFAWNSAAFPGTCFGLGFGGKGCAGIGFGGSNDIFLFPVGSFLAPGNFTSGGLSVNIAAVATPEPGSLALMLSGVGLVFGMRKRWGLLQAS